MAMVTWDMIISRGKCQLLTVPNFFHIVMDIAMNVRYVYGSASPVICFIFVVYDIK